MKVASVNEASPVKITLSKRASPVKITLSNEAATVKVAPETLAVVKRHRARSRFMTCTPWRSRTPSTAAPPQTDSHFGVLGVLGREQSSQERGTNGSLWAPGGHLLGGDLCPVGKVTDFPVLDSLHQLLLGRAVLVAVCPHVQTLCPVAPHASTWG